MHLYTSICSKKINYEQNLIYAGCTNILLSSIDALSILPGCLKHKNFLILLFIACAKSPLCLNCGRHCCAKKKRRTNPAY